MGSFQVSGSNVQVTVETRITARAAEPQQQPLPPAPPAPSPLDQGDAVEFKKQTSDPLDIAKKIAGGVLIGGGAGTLANGIVNSIAADRLTAPTLTGVGIGVSMGAGIGLLNLETGDETTNQIKNTAAGALIGGSAMAIANSAVRSIGFDQLSGPSGLGVGIGIALGTGIGLVNLDTGDKNTNAIKNTVAGALIGGSAVGIAGSAIASMAADRLTHASPVAFVIGAAIGAGIGLLNTEK
jgi:hypothetical protein